MGPLYFLSRRLARALVQVVYHIVPIVVPEGLSADVQSLCPDTETKAAATETELDPAWRESSHDFPDPNPSWRSLC